MLKKLKYTFYANQMIMVVSITSMFLWTSFVLVNQIINPPKPIVIGLDKYGARILSANDNEILRQEKISFLKRFLFLAYNYTSLNYPYKISAAGDLMKNSLWSDKEDEFKLIFDKLKNSNLNQESSLNDLREIDDNNYDAYLTIVVKTKLKKSEVKIKVSLTINKHERNIDNPFGWEVIKFNEQNNI